MVIIYRYLEREIDKVLKLYVNNNSFLLWNRKNTLLLYLNLKEGWHNLLCLGSGGFKGCGARAENICGALVWKILLIRVIFQKFYFFSFLYITECAGKKSMFFTGWVVCLFSTKMCLKYFGFKKNLLKIKNTGCIQMFSCVIIETFNC